MEHVLRHMRQFSQRCVEILSEVVGIDVSIVDDSLLRIAGSGRMKLRTGHITTYGNIASTALKTKQTVVVDEAILHPLCKDCPSSDHCDNLSELWTPILLNDTPIGCIGCICYSKEQQAMFLERKSTYVNFFEQFAVLLSNRAHDLLEDEKLHNIRFMLEHVLEKVQIGTLILNKEGKIHDINVQGRRILELDEDFTKFHQLQLIICGNKQKKQYEIVHNKNHFTIIGNIYPLSLDPYDQLLLFSAIEDKSPLTEELLGIPPSTDLTRIIGNSRSIQTLKRNIQQVSASNSSILITGESGTGKELVAQAIHSESPRSDGPFIAVNCAALPENLLESELFGYVKGAFTGANPHGKIGLLESAEGGTFFMDEIGDMPLALQSKLLRVLEQREVTRLGSNVPIPLNVRFIFATHRKLSDMVEEGTFRSDLYYRINVIPLIIPPLRQRHNDIRLLSEHFIQKFSKEMNKKVISVKEEFWYILEHYDWPGNIRELQNVIEYTINMMPASGILYPELLLNRLTPSSSASVFSYPTEQFQTLEQMEEIMIRQCLEQHKNDKDGKRLAAKQLGIGLATLYRKMKKYDIS